MSSGKVIKGLLKYAKKDINWIDDSSDAIRGKAAYNAALKHISESLDLFIDGHMGDEFIQTLIRLGEEK